MAQGKKYRAAAERIDRDVLYSPLAAVRVIKQSATANFDETIEVHFRLGIDTRQADQMVRGSISLPNGTCK
ncbi:MAG: 50S ribosomal protein L1, partial [Actinomycetota bacterium]|nr:50S ribosomal protein L1 [Actinomycetota bacterium]